MAPPAALAYLWEWFKEVSAGRPQAMSGVAPLPWAEFNAWSAMSGIRPTTWELGVLRRLDQALVGMER